MRLGSGITVAPPRPLAIAAAVVDLAPSRGVPTPDAADIADYLRGTPIDALSPRGVALHAGRGGQAPHSVARDRAAAAPRALDVLT
jgi:hypothetical protein